jgi:hypothetical protein
MKEKKGIRLGETGMDTLIVGGTKQRAEILNKRTSGFEGLSHTDLQREVQSRPEYAAMQRAKDKMMEGEDQPTKWPGKEAADQTNSLLSELVTAMKQNVTQTSRVAMNTN